MNNIVILLRRTLDSIQMNYTEQAIENCIEYIMLLSVWNKKTNLVGKSLPYEIASDLCLDSIHLAFILEQYCSHIQHSIDFGAGAGIPGIPLRCFYTSGRYTMVESRQKRISFIQQALQTIPLENTFCIKGRVEKVCTQFSIDAIVSRAFMPPETLVPFASQFLEKGKYLILMLNTEDIDITGYTKIISYGYDINVRRRYSILLQKM